MWLDKLNNNPIPWLMESNPWTKYQTLSNLLDDADPNEMKLQKSALLSHPLIQKKINETENWFEHASGRHNDPQTILNTFSSYSAPCLLL